MHTVSHAPHRFVLLLASLLGLLVVQGCHGVQLSGGPTTASVRYGSYRGLETASFDTSRAAVAPGTDAAQAADELKQEIARVVDRDLHENVWRGAGRRKLLMEFALLEITPGSRMLRWLAGPFGAGKMTFTVTARLRDSQTGLVMGDYTASGYLRNAIAGGSRVAIYRRYAKLLRDKIVEAK